MKITRFGKILGCSIEKKKNTIYFKTKENLYSLKPIFIRQFLYLATGRHILSGKKYLLAQ